MLAIWPPLTQLQPGDRRPTYRHRSWWRTSPHRLPELQTEATLPAGEKSDLEQSRLYRLVIEPGPHLGHGGGQVSVTAPKPRQCASTRLGKVLMQPRK